MPKGCGIYGIVNLINDRIYVGQAVNLRIRRDDHFFNLRRGKHFNQHLQRAFNKYGEENFWFVVLRYCEPDELDWYEQRWLDKHSRDQKYNTALDAASPMRGRKHTAETKLKMSKSRKPILTPEFREHLRQRSKEINTPEYRRRHGRKIRKAYTPEVRKRLSQSLTGRKRTQAERDAISRGKRKSVTPEFREKIRRIRLASIAANPNQMSAAHKARIGTKHTPEAIEKMRLAKLGKRKCHTPRPPT